MKRDCLLWLLTCAIAAVTATEVRAEWIFSGLIDNAGPSATTTYGIDGYDLYSTSAVGDSSSLDTGLGAGGAFAVGNRLTLLPYYVSSITANGVNNSAAAWGYSTIDNPLGGTIQAGFTYNRGSTSTERDLLDINLGANVPTSFYIGLITDTSYVERDYLDGIRLRSALGGSNTGLITTTGDRSSGVDVYMFRIDGALPNDVITISGLETTQSPSGLYNDIGVSGLVFTAVPAPSSLATLIGVGVMVFGMERWKKRRRRG